MELAILRTQNITACLVELSGFHQYPNQKRGIDLPTSQLSSTPSMRRDDEYTPAN